MVTVFNSSSSALPSSKRLIGGLLAAAMLAFAAGVAAPPPTVSADHDDVAACPSSDSYGVQSENSVTKDKKFACASMRSSGKIKVSPWGTKSWTTSAPSGYYRQTSSRWRQSSAISFSSAEVAPVGALCTAPSYTTTGSNSNISNSRYFAVNVLMVAPHDCVPDKGPGSVGSGYYSTNADDGRAGVLDPKWNRSQLQAAGDASHRIKLDSAFRYHGFRVDTNPTTNVQTRVEFCRKDGNGNPAVVNGKEDCDNWSLNVGAFCVGYFSGAYRAVPNQPGASVPDDCRTVMCDSPQKSGTTLPAFCTPPAIDPAALTDAGALEPQGVGALARPNPDGTILLEDFGSLAEPPSLQCPQGSAPIFVEAALLAGNDTTLLDGIDDLEPVIGPGGASIAPRPEFDDPAFDSIRTGLQVTCRTLGLKMVTRGGMVLGTERADFITGRRASMTFFLGLGNDEVLVASSAASAVVLAGPGADKVTAWGKSSVVRGGPGNDTLTASGADILLIGGLGQDRLVGAKNAVTRINALDGQPGDVVVCNSSKNGVLADPGDTIIGPCTVHSFR